MNKGQIFSTDLLFGLILVVFGIGVLIGSAEINTYNQQQQINHSSLVKKTITGAEIITNSIEWDCDFNQTHVAYSINTTKFNPKNFSLEEIKTKTNLVDYNIRIMIDEEVIYEDIESATYNMLGQELKIITCTNETKFNELKECIINGEEICLNETTTINNKILKLEVAK